MYSQNRVYSEIVFFKCSFFLCIYGHNSINGINARDSVFSYHHYPRKNNEELYLNSIQVNLIYPDSLHYLYKYQENFYNINAYEDVRNLLFNSFLAVLNCVALTKKLTYCYQYPCSKLLHNENRFLVFQETRTSYSLEDESGGTEISLEIISFCGCSTC